MKTTTIIALIVATLAIISSCKDEPVTPDQKKPEPKDTIVTPKENLTDTIARLWVISEATHKGSPDGSSKGLVLDIYKDNTYKLVSTGYIGTWKFIENETKVVLDEATPQYKTTWTIVSISSKKLIVTFKSPFTGGSAEWVMIPK